MLDTYTDELIREIESSTPECESSWHKTYSWPAEKAVVLMNSFCGYCTASNHHVPVGEQCLNHLNKHSDKSFRCLNCQRAGYIMVDVVEI